MQPLTFRYFIIHPKKENLDDLNMIEYENINESLKNGWKAYERLYVGLKHPHDENSWEVMSDFYS